MENSASAWQNSPTGVYHDKYVQLWFYSKTTEINPPRHQMEVNRLPFSLPFPSTESFVSYVRVCIDSLPFCI